MFFPYGNWGRGYIIPTQQDHDRLQRKSSLTRR
jgi:hypothetical protein